MQFNSTKVQPLSTTLSTKGNPQYQITESFKSINFDEVSIFATDQELHSYPYTLTFNTPDRHCIPAKKYPGYYKGKAR